MKQIIKRGSFLTLMFLLLGCLSLYAADNDLITRQITIQLEEAGTLPDRIGSSKKYQITNLKIIGEINGTDLSMIRDMAGSDNTDGKLSVLDLSEAKIVRGGVFYYNHYYTSNNEIGTYAFSYCSRLTSLTLPAGITSIGEDAFWGCSELTSLNLPASITSIGTGAFYGCSGLTSLTLPAGITEIGSYTFCGCSGLTSLTLPAGITSIGSYAFLDCSGLTSLTLPAGITEIGGGAFSGCSGLTSLTLPAGTKIGTGAFSGCSGLTSLTLPAGITEIGGGAFSGCSGLTSLTLTASITSIGDGTFKGCSGLTSIYVYAEKVPGIGSNAFEGVDAKKCTLYVPMGTRDDYWLSGFGDYFENIVEFDATGIDKITINLEKAGTLPDRIGSNYLITNLKIIGEINGTDLKMIREMAGSNSTGNSTDGKLSVLDLSEAKIVKGGDCYYIDDYNKNYYTSNDVIGSSAFKGCSGLTSLNLPAGITSIGSSAFKGCSGLTSLNLPAGITKIGYSAFEGCSGLTSLNLPAGITSIGGSAFNGCSGLTSLTLPAGITEISNSAFWGCSGLTSLTLPASITKIGSFAFYGCSGLTSLTLPAGITEIGEDAFLGCSGLTSLTLPASITKIGDGAFCGCSGLTSIYVYAEKVPEIDSYSFVEVDAKKCTLYVPMGTSSDYRLSDFGDYFKNIVEFDVTGIDKTTTSTDVEEVARYSVNGQRLSAPTKGLNIVKYSDGSLKKVAVQ